MSKYRCVIFDCDGVLVDSESIGNQVLVDMANDHGANIDLTYAMKHFKGSFMKACIEKIAELATQPLKKDFEQEYRRKSFDAFKKNIQPIKGVKEVLDNIKLPFCVASSGPVNKIKLNLELTGLLPYFGDNIFSCYAINKWKPDPDIFLWAAKQMGYNPNECLVVEDSISGVKAALNGGFDVFGYTEQAFNDELKGVATKTFCNMDELLLML